MEVALDCRVREPGPQQVPVSDSGPSLSTLFSEAGPPVAGGSCGLVSKAAVGRGTCKNRESESNGQFIFTHSRQAGDGLRRVIAGRDEQGRHTLAWSVFFFLCYWASAVGVQYHDCYIPSR